MTIIPTPRVLAAPPLRWTANSLVLAAGLLICAPYQGQARTRRAVSSTGGKKPLAVAKAAVVPSAARVSLTRARQLAAQGADVLAERELLHAVALAPSWVEAQRELARYQTRRGHWTQAAAAWRSVLFLKRDDVEAKAQFDRARRFQTQGNLPHVVELGQSSTNPLMRDPLTSTLQSAQTTPARTMTPQVQTEAPDAATTGSASSDTTTSSLNSDVASQTDAASTEAAPQADATTGNASTDTTGTTTSGAETDTTNASSNASVAETNPAPANSQTPEDSASSADITSDNATTGAAPLNTTPSTGATDNPTGSTSSGATATGSVATGGAATSSRPSFPPLSLGASSSQGGFRGASRTVGSPATSRALSPRALVLPRLPAQKVSRRRQAAAWPFVNRAVRALIAHRYPQALGLYQQSLRSDPNNLEGQLGVSETLSILKRFTSSETAYRQILAATPGEVRAQRGLANVLAYQKRYPEAIARFRKIVAANPKDFQSVYQLAQILTWTKRYSEATPLYKKALALQPRNVDALTTYGNALTYAQQYSQARAAFERALKLQPKSVAALVGIGNSYNWNRDYRLAIARYRQALNLQSQNQEALLGLGQALTFSDQPEAAVTPLRKAVALAPNSDEAHLSLGRALVFSGQDREGQAQLQRVLGHEPNNVDALALLAQSQTVSISSSAERVAALSTLQRLLALQTNPEDQATTLVSIADVRLNSGDAAGAAEALRDARRRAPRNAQAATSYAQLLIGQRPASGSQNPADEAARQAQLDEAEAVVEEVLARDKNNVRALVLDLVIQSEKKNPERVAALKSQLASLPPAAPAETVQLAFALRNANDPEAAQALVQSLLDRNPNTPGLLLQVANFERDTGDNGANNAQWDQARALYERILKAAPNNMDARLNFARLLSWQKDFDQSLQQVDAVLKAEPNNKQARDIHLEVKSFRDSLQAPETVEDEARAILKTDPNNVTALNVLSNLLQIKKDFAGAVAGYRRVVQLDSGNLQARLGLARNLYYSKQVDDSINEYKDLLGLAPNDTIVKLDLAHVYLDLNRLDDAEELFTQVVNARSNTLPQPERTSLLQMRRNARVSPLMALPREGANATSQTKPPAHEYSWRGTSAAAKSKGVASRVRLAQGDVASSAPNTMTGSTPSPQTGAVGGAASQPAATADTTTDATAATSDAAAIPDAAAVPDATAATSDAVGSAATSGDAGAATTGVEGTGAAPTAADAAPRSDSTAGTSEPGSTMATSTGNETAASTATKSPEQIATDARVDALTGLGEIRRRQLRYPEAEDYFNKALALKEDDINARLGLARALRSEGKGAPDASSLAQSNFEAAQAETERVLALRKNNLEARVLHAQLRGDQGKPEEAQKEFDALIASLPTENPSRVPVETWLTLSQAFAEVRNYNAALDMLDSAREGYPTDLTVPLRTGEVLTAAKKWPEALAAFKSVLDKTPDDVSALLGRSRVYNYSNQLEQAEASYRDTLQAEPDNYPALVEFADILSRRGDFGDSIEAYQKAIAQNPDDRTARLEMARTMRYARQYTAAAATLEELLQTDVNYAPAYTERGILRGQQGNYDPAIADLRRALEITPRDLTAQLGLAEVLGYAGRYKESISLYRAALKRDATNEKARVELGLVLSYARNYPEALAEFNTVLAKNRQNVNAQIGRADTLARSGQVTNAISAYRAILARDNRNVRAQTGLAEAYVYGRQYPDAIAIYNNLIASDSGNDALRIARGRTLGYAGRYAEAIRALQPIVQADPRNTQARLALAEVLTNSGDAGSRRRAISEYQAVIAAQPSNIPARLGLGRALSYNGDYSQAREQLEIVLRAQPKNEEALLALAGSERYANQPFDARSAYRDVVAVNPQNAAALQAISELRRATSPSVTLAGHSFTDSNGVRLRSVLFGPTLRTRFGTFGLTGETGTYEDDGVRFHRRALNLLLARQFGPTQIRLLLNKVNYGAAPSRNLFDVLVQQNPDPRRRYFLNVGKREIIESLGAVQQGITANEYRAGFNYPIARRLDASVAFSRFNYSDNNDRNTLDVALMARLFSTAPSTFRVGLGYRRDDTRFISPLYYTPQNYNSLSALADYTVRRRGLDFGISAAYPLTGDQGAGGINRPARTLFGFVTYDVNDAFQLFLNGGIVDAPTYNSTDVTLGGTYFF